jgi:hypothetical protein
MCPRAEDLIPSDLLGYHCIGISHSCVFFLVSRRLTDFFEVQYAALPHFEEKYDDFVADATVLRRRFTSDGKAGSPT